MSVQLFCSMVEARAISGVATAQEQNVELLCSLLLMLVARLMREPTKNVVLRSCAKRYRVAWRYAMEQAVAFAIGWPIEKNMSPLSAETASAFMPWYSRIHFSCGNAGTQTPGTMGRTCC